MGQVNKSNGYDKSKAKNSQFWQVFETLKHIILIRIWEGLECTWLFQNP